MRNAIGMVGLAMGLVLSACGETDPGVDRIVGTWQPTSGTIRKACPGAVPTTENPGRDVFWSAGVNSDLVSTTPLTPCRLKADVVAGTAVGIPDDRCTVADGAGATSTVIFSRYTFAVSSDGRTATESANGDITRVQNGVATGCSFEATGAYQKVRE
jgi:hypothetical protein